MFEIDLLRLPVLLSSQSTSSELELELECEVKVCGLYKLFHLYSVDNTLCLCTSTRIYSCMPRYTHFHQYIRSPTACPIQSIQSTSSLFIILQLYHHHYYLGYIYHDVLLGRHRLCPPIAEVPPGSPCDCFISSALLSSLFSLLSAFCFLLTALISSPPIMASIARTLRPLSTRLATRPLAHTPRAARAARAARTAVPRYRSPSLLPLPIRH